MNGNERVSLQYSISIDELPEEVSRLVDKVSTQVANCHTTMLPQLIKMGPNERLSLAACQSINEVRDQLTAALCVLDDVNNIVEGYVKHQAHTLEPPPATPKEAPPAMPTESGATPTAHYVTDPLAMSNAMTELQQKLKLFQTGTPPNEEPTATERE